MQMLKDLQILKDLRTKTIDALKAAVIFLMVEPEHRE